jgi:hypothetical protein
MERRRRESGIDFGVHAVMMVSPSKDVSTLAYNIRQVRTEWRNALGNAR